MTSVPDDTLEQVLRIFFRLLDLSRDLERNDDDAQFRAEGGVIHYLLDADLFEVFIQPWDIRGRSASLHGRAWRISSGPNPPGWNSISAQTALSATEYLVSGKLPAQRDQRILMTHEHRWELARRVEAMADEYASVLARASAESSQERFKQAVEVRECVRTPNDDLRMIRRFDHLLYEDLLELRAKKVDVNSLTSFAGTRATLKALVDDRELEPAEQVERIVGPVLRHRFVTLHQVFAVRPEEHKSISADTQRWFWLLLEEAKLQGVQIADKSASAQTTEKSQSSRSAEKNVDDESDRGRSRGALWDDARSLATARWVALRRLDSKERLVFVTADDLLFDTYRRWYANLLPSDFAYSEPFILRRPVQFAPMFNLTDSGKLSGTAARQVFQDMRHLLEINLLTLNLSRLSARSANESILTRMRELTALRQRDPSPIATDKLYRALASALREKAKRGELKGLGEILDNLRVLERFALGQVDDHVRARLTDRQTRMLGLNEKGKDDRTMVRYVGDLVHKMLAVSIKVWLPLAKESIEAWNPRVGQKLIRAPIAIRLKVMVEGNPVDVGDALHSRLYQEKGITAGPLFTNSAWSQVENDEALVFAIAAVLALASDDWSNAVHFSERAQKTQSARGGNEERLAEYEYLSAIAKRFRIGSQGVPKSADALSRIVRTYRAALQSLDWCVSYHEAGDKKKGEAHVVRLLRSVSERAALRLFFTHVLTPAVDDATAYANAGSQILSANDYAKILDGDRVSVARDCVAGAEADLERCLTIDRGLEVSTEDRRRALSTVRRQYLVNICSSAVARHLLRMPHAEWMTSPLNNELKDKVRTFLTQNADKAHLLMRAEMLGYLALSGEASATGEIAKLGSVDFPSEALALDRALFNAIGKEAINGFS